MDATIGRNIREARERRGLTIRAAAELSGLSYGYLAKIERGEKPVTKRGALDSLALTLRVSPADLVGKPYPARDPLGEELREGMGRVEDALTGWRVDEKPDAAVRPWREIASEIDLLNKVLRPNADYLAQATLLPKLIPELLALAADQTYRRPALLGLIGTYKSIAYVSLDLGIPGVPSLAVERMRQAAEELEDAEAIADVAWRRAQIIGGRNRFRQRELASAIADDMQVPKHLRGMANLTAAMASAVVGDEDTALGRLGEAAELAAIIDTDDRPWTRTDFTRTNVDIWRVSIGVELGYGPKVAELAQRGRPPQPLRVAHRQAAFWSDLGRALLPEKSSRARGISALLKAEQLTPQKIRTNVFVREIVSNQLHRVRRDSDEGRELRGLAWRLGVAPTG
ncbi:helix-turn-helix domain-containing protein [Amycolatopsis sp. CA-230715]|uniref:helix-turn-helix domain-containing protein n=1 Tax=Amycolatopsis sp. CA-230715 TaxID=2745196 RepID=UPI001C00F42B|nr:helix-turn-helix transcriptional regulator [Amycolatopsis sp. CA-230715]